MILVRGDSAGSALDPRSYDEVVDVRLHAPQANACFQVQNVTNAIISSLSAPYRDLLEIAAYVYIADTETVRWSERDVLNRKWMRDFHFVLPVLDRSLWDDVAVQRKLVQTLELATGDRFRFTFEQQKPRSEQLFSSLTETPFPGADAVCLFSGGADSAAGVLHLREDLRVHPLLISHRSSANLDSRQANILTLLNARYIDRPLGQVSMWLHRRGVGAKESSQRSRGFLFVALASAVAKQRSLSRVYVPENGFVSLNVRKLQQSYSTTLSQTTHPEFLRAFEELLALIGGPTTTISNPFAFETKADVIGRFRSCGAEALLQETVSCAHTQGQSRLQPHCGVCSQCVDRRFAAIAVGLESHDLPDRYEIDIFADEIPEGEPLMQVESHLRLAARIAMLSEDGLANEFVELVGAAVAMDGDVAVNAQQLVGMLRRFSDQVRSAFADKLREKSDDLIAGRLPPHSVLRLGASGQHLRNQPAHIASLVGELLGNGLPLAFASRKPKDENELQDTAEALVRSEAPKWVREGPMLPFSVVKTKPDFSLAEPRFFIELKYPKTRARLNGVITEITSRVHIYGSQGASVLFGVYDPSRAIRDDQAFIAGLALPPSMFARVFR